MSKFKREFIKDFFLDYPDKVALKDFIQNGLPLSPFDKNFLICKYCDEKYPNSTPNKILAHNLRYSQRYVIELHNNIITRALPYVNIIFIQALSASPKNQS